MKRSALLFALVLAGCQNIPVAVNPAETPVVLTGSTTQGLETRMSYPNSDLAILRDGVLRPQAFADDYKLVGVSSAMVVNGGPVRATTVAIQGNYAFVAYATEGATSQGGLEVIDISNPSTPQVVSSLGLEYLDVYAVYPDLGAGEVYFAGAANSDGLGVSNPSWKLPSPARPAYLAKVSFKDGTLSKNYSFRLTQRGFAVNSLIKTNAGLYLSSGDAQARATDITAGGAGLISANDLSTQSWSAFSRSQSLAVANNQIFALEAGTKGSLRIYDSFGGAPVQTIDIGNVGPVDGQNTIYADQQYLYVAKGSDGLEIFSLNEKRSVFRFANRIPNGMWVNPNEYLTNAVTTDGDLVYIAGGAAGVYVARVGSSFNYAGTFDLKDPSGKRGSANFVAADSAKRLLFVASGDGGLKIIRRNIPNSRSVGTGIMARGNIRINGTQTLQNGTQVLQNNAATPLPQVSSIVSKAMPTNCAKTLSGTQNVANQAALDTLFGSSSCLSIVGDLNTNFLVALSGKTLVVSGAFNANSGLRASIGSVVLAARPTINSSLSLENSSLIATGSNTELNINAQTTTTGSSTIASAGSLSFNGGMAVASTDEYPNLLLVAHNKLVVNGGGNLKAVLWSGADMSINGGLTLVGAMMSGTTITINGGIAATYESRSDNPNL